MRYIDPVSIEWHKSTRCNHGECIEVASLRTSVAVRDSKDNTNGPRLAFASSQWRLFIKDIKDGRADS
jgi:Domain of unknown function (DUF397)